jgi:hypothetical protein
MSSDKRKAPSPRRGEEAQEPDLSNVAAAPSVLWFVVPLAALVAYALLAR